MFIPEGESHMRVPPVNERVKEAPAQALRAMFAGIGQLLLVTDRFRGRTPENEAAQENEAQGGGTATATAPSETATSEAATTEAATTEAAEQASVADQATAEPATEPDAVAAPEATATTVEAEAPASPVEAEVTPATEATEAEASTLPLSNYDELTIPSLRARLRNLSADQLTQLIGYEKSHANRPEIIAMFERRIVKLAEG